MVKNRRQVEEFINSVQPEDETQKMAILGYCRTVLGIRVNFKEDNVDLPTVNLSQFKKYVNEGIFQCGDVVLDIKNGGMGIVCSMNLKNLSLLAYIDKDGHLHEKMVDVLRMDCRLATQEQMTEIQRKLYQAGLGWNKRKCVLFSQRYVPQDNQQVRLSVLGRKMGLGVFKEIDADGWIVMYCVKMEGEDARYSLHEVVGRVEDYQIDQISTYERNIFTEELKKAGVSWNGHIKQIKTINQRVAQGETYYYVDDTFEIIATADEYKARDTKRLMAGNYFTSPDKAERLLKLIIRETGYGTDKSKDNCSFSKWQRRRDEPQFQTKSKSRV